MQAYTLGMKILRMFCFFSFIVVVIALTLTSAAQQAQEVTKPQTSKRASFDVIGISVRTNNGAESGADGQIPKTWQRLFAEGLLNNIPDRADDGVVAVYSKYASDANGDYTFTLGAKVKPGTKPPNGMVAITVPAGKYLEFDSAKGPGAEVIPATWRQIYGYFQDPSNPLRAYNTDFEIYEDLSDPNAMQGHIFIGVKP